ncbi:hypothetical protein SUGI_0314000 [Cryptomeria japonica]|nr:hypothetical protein SUGI_0314000 [Cryptomeria japonica]
MDRGSAADSRLIRSASVVESARVRRALSRWRPVEREIDMWTELLRHGPVEGKKVFYCFQNGAGREKRKKEPERSSRSTDKSSVQEEEVYPGSGADSRLMRSAIVVESASCRWKPIEAQKRRSVSIFASGTRNLSFQQINRISAELKPPGVVEVYSGACRNYFLCSPARLFSLFV